MSYTFSPREVTFIIDVTRRQLQLWDESHLIRPSRNSVVGKRKRRMYSPEDLFYTILLQEMKLRNFSVRSAREVFRLLRASYPNITDGAENMWLMTNGCDIRVVKHSDLVVAFMEARRVRYSVIPLHCIVVRVWEATRKFGTPDKKVAQSEWLKNKDRREA